MGGPLPAGDPVPDDGSLPPAARTATGSTLSCYLHVPFCVTRCGYCDFNTYTPEDLGERAEGGDSRSSFVAAALAEVELARRVLAGDPRRLATVFFGGGTPTLLSPVDLGRLLQAVRAAFGLADDAEITTEANPESVDAAALAALVGEGFNRLSLGMQSAVPEVLATLDRRHTPGRAEAAVAEARAAGFASVSLDLIYGAPGESLADWRVSLERAIAAGPDHVSAYALIVEEGTPLARRIKRGELTAPDDDELADKYLLAEQLLTEAGLENYELSNWARPGHESRHNGAYWRSADWWGIGPGAHSHVGGTRWWNVKQPRSYAALLAAGKTPAAAREVLEPQARRVERVLLETRLREGLPLGVLTATERVRLREPVARGLAVVADERLTLTLRGRLLADAVVRDLLD